MSTIDNEFINPFQSNNQWYIQYFRSNERWFQPTIAVQWGKNDKHTQELEITQLSVDRKDEGPIGGLTWPWGGSFTTEQRLMHFAIRYEYILGLSQNSDNPLQPSIGFGLMPYFIRHTQIMSLSSTNSYQETFKGFFTFVTPRIEYKVTNKVGVDFNIPVAFSNWFYFDDIRTNDRFPANNQVRPYSLFKVFPNYLSFRLGLLVAI